MHVAVTCSPFPHMLSALDNAPALLALITGWAGSTQVAIRLATREAFRAATGDTVVQLSVSGDRIPAVSLADEGMRVETYVVSR